MKTHPFLLPVLSAFLASCSSHYSLLVIDADTKEPIPNAMVYSVDEMNLPFIFSDRTWISVTDENGIAKNVTLWFYAGHEGYLIRSSHPPLIEKNNTFTIELAKDKPDSEKYFQGHSIPFPETEKTLLKNVENYPLWKRFYEYSKTQNPKWDFAGDRRRK